MKILFSNIGYAKNISGSLWQHITRANRHFYCSLPAQKKALSQLKKIIDSEKPDICGIVEIDEGSAHTGYFRQINELIDEEYHFYDIADKYGEGNRISQMPLHMGKCNAVLARKTFNFEKLYFRSGTKRLIYKLQLPGDIDLFFTHFSLRRETRKKQFLEMRQLINPERKTILMGDFNIMGGFSELQPLLHENNLKILNDEADHTFRFSQKKLALDLCICSENIEASLKIIPQPFSDHSALVVEI